MLNFLIRLGNVIHFVGFILGLFLGIRTAFWGYGFLIGILYFIFLNGIGFTINYLMTGNGNFLPFINNNKE